MAEKIETTVEVIDEKGSKKYKMSKPKLEILIEDPQLEEIMINKPDIPVFIYHRKHGMCETNLKLSQDQMLELIGDTASNTSDYISKNKPFLDARLPDGSRFNATIPPASPEGPTITIRKFRENPLSIVDLIWNKTLDAELAAFLWMAIEGEKNYPLNTLVIGGAGSGKTTTLNILSAFIPLEDRVITIEDTLELNFYGRKNVVRMESVPGSEKRKGVSMNDLLKNALRMRPDRIIVGEVRGEEAESLFNAMNVGHSAMGTLHANSPKEATARLTNAPMNVPKNMLPLIDLIVFEQKIRSPEGLKRRIVQVSEISRSEVGVSFSEVFMYDPKKDMVYRTDVPSQKEEEIAKLSGLTLAKLKKKNKDKQALLEAWLEKGIKNFHEVQQRIKDYYIKSG